jgi:hypothetical protein
LKKYCAKSCGQCEEHENKKNKFYKKISKLESCYKNLCRNGATCFAVSDYQYACNCVSGFSGQYCERGQLNKDCDSNPCENGGICINNGGVGFTCICQRNFEKN